MLGFDGLVCDLDGVLYRGPEAVPGAAAKIAELRDAGIGIVFATNNATATVDQYRLRLQNLGVDTTPEEVLTSAVVTAEVVAQRGWTNRTVFLIGLDGIREELTKLGMRFLDVEEAREAELVVASGDWRLTYDKLRAANFALREGARFVATNDDRTYPAADGLWPGAGAILAALEAASGRKAEIMGKPYRPMMEAAARRLEGCKNIAVVGDQPLTDLVGGRTMGWRTILVLTGVTADAGPVRPEPDLVLPSIADLEVP
jgi:4-nitrophenyl phosphatase